MYSNEYQKKADQYQRKEKHKQHKQHKPRKLIALIIIFFLLISVVIFFNSSFSRIVEIKITGLNLLNENEIYEKAKININMQYLFTSSARIEKKLLGFKEIKDVEVTKQFPGKLNINIVEYEPVTLLYYNNKWFPVLENGYIYQRSYENIYVNYPLITKWNDLETIPQLVEELNEVNPKVLMEISEIQQNPQNNNPDQLLLITREGYKVHITLKDISEKLNHYPTIVESLKAKSSSLGNIYLFESMRFEEFKPEEQEDKNKT